MYCIIVEFIVKKTEVMLLLQYNLSCRFHAYKRYKTIVNLVYTVLQILVVIIG